MKGEKGKIIREEFAVYTDVTIIVQHLVLHIALIRNAFQQNYVLVIIIIGVTIKLSHEFRISFA